MSRKRTSSRPKAQSFADFKSEGANWITLATGEYYPDILKDACELYKPVLVLFGQSLKTSESSTRLFLQIAEQTDGWMRVELARVFRKYVSPIQKVQAAFATRPVPDEALCAVLWENKDRGKKGFDLTERFFSLFRSSFPDLLIKGPERAGRDVLMGEVFDKYPNPGRPVDFVVFDKTGLARYDSDRGGAQEDDRTGGYNN